MKTIFIFLFTIASSIASYANQPGKTCCTAVCTTPKAVVLASSTSVPSASSSNFSTGMPESIATKMASIEDVHENQKGYLNFQQTMSAALNQLETEKHLSALEDLKGLSAFGNTMTSAFMQIEAIKHAEASENAQALLQFNNLMEKALNTSSCTF